MPNCLPSRFQLEEHRHHVTAHAEERALTEAQDSAVAPDQYDSNRAKTERQILRQPGRVGTPKRERHRDQKNHRKDWQAEPGQPRSERPYGPAAFLRDTNRGR